MITPAASEASSVYFKIGSTVTFSWNYTSVQATPTGVNIEAYCATNKYIVSPTSANKRFYYPIASNLSFDETLLEWDTGAYDANATIPLLTYQFPFRLMLMSAMYTLYIFDESRSVTAIPSAGYLGSFNGYVFGLYDSQPYTPLPSTVFSWVVLILATTCVICSGSSRRVAGTTVLMTMVLGMAFAYGGWRVVAG
jgi:hypothetical protein